MNDPCAATVTPPTGLPVVRPGAPSWVALEPDRRSAKTARVFTRTLLADDPREFVDDVELVVDELVANAIVHIPKSYVVPPGVSPLIHLSLLPMRRWVIVTVRDPWPGTPQSRQADGLAEDGRGLTIVRALAAGCWPSYGKFDKVMRAVVLRPGCSLRAGELDRLQHP